MNGQRNILECWVCVYRWVCVSVGEGESEVMDVLLSVICALQPMVWHNFSHRLCQSSAKHIHLKWQTHTHTDCWPAIMSMCDEDLWLKLHTGTPRDHPGRVNPGWSAKGQSYNGLGTKRTCNGWNLPHGVGSPGLLAPWSQPGAHQKLLSARETWVKWWLCCQYTERQLITHYARIMIKAVHLIQPNHNSN